MASYVTTTEADEYFGARLRIEAWEEASPEERETALEMATRMIDAQRLVGRRAEEDQELAFPRKTMTKTGWWSSEEVPQDIKDACCEQALFLLELTPYERRRMRQHELGVVSQQIGEVTERSSAALVMYNQQNMKMCKEAMQLLKPYIVGKVRIT